jgi:hypothetical protein
MSEDNHILLGYEVGSANPVYLPLHHLAIFGMTQLSGKTTTLEALISRSGLKAIAFIVKRGEAGFSKYNPVTPYYKPRADWQFVEGLVNVALGEKVKYEPGMRYGIMKVCKGHKDLKEIQKAAQELARETKHDFMKSVYEKLVAYLEIVIPELEKWVFSEKLELDEGINVMNLSGMRLETQHIVIASTIEYAFANLDHVIVIIPEAWETIPQGKMTPVKWVAQQFIRKGAALGNYLWLDSQDIGGIDKTPLRQCDNWLMGRMKEAHEVERIMKQLLGMKIPAEEIQTLPLGHFYAAIGNDVKKVYVLPIGVPEELGIEVALGKRSPESIREEFLKVKVMESDDLVWKEKFEEEKRKNEELEKKLTENEQDRYNLSVTLSQLNPKEFANLKEQNLAFRQQLEQDKSVIEELKTTAKDLEPLLKLKEAILELLPFQQNSSRTETSVNLNNSELTVNVSHSERTIEMDTTKQQGQMLYVAIHDLPKEGFTETEMSDALKEKGWPISHGSLAPQLNVNLPKLGLLIPLNEKPKKYRLPLKLKINVKEN